MDKQPVGQLPDLTQSNNDDEIMVITNSEYNQLKKEKISDLITDFTSTDENNALIKGTDGKMFVTDFGNASNITEGTLPVSVLPNIPKNKLPPIETSDLPDSGITAGTYTYPTDIVVNSKGQVTSITEGAPGANNANQDLSNLSETGEKHFLNKTQVTNCILEIPQNINLTISNGVLTLNQGCIVYIPDGFESDGRTPKFLEKVVSSDATSVQNRTGQNFAFATFGASGAGALFTYSINKVKSGTDYSGFTGMFYDTSTNKISLVTNGTIQSSGYSLPVGIATATSTSDSKFESIDQVFNGIGYIGKTLFALPNVKGLIPNGRNADGTLNNTELTLSKPITYTRTDTLTGSYGLLITSVSINASSTEYNYTKNLNILPSSGATTNGILIGSVTHKNGEVTSIKVDEPFTAVDYNDFYELQNNSANKDLSNLTNGLANVICTTAPTETSSASAQNPAVVIENYVNGTSWYRVWSDGWCEQGGELNILGEITFLKQFVNSNYSALATRLNKSGTKFPLRVTNRTITGMTVTASGDTHWSCIWVAKGYIS